MNHDIYLPKFGVYGITCNLDNKFYEGILNIGITPTVKDSTKIKIEAHIFDFNNNVFSFGLSIFGLVIVAYLHSLYKSEESSINRFSLILIIAGALGNILDRLLDGVVTDFLFFHVGEYL